MYAPACSLKGNASVADADADALSASDEGCTATTGPAGDVGAPEGRPVDTTWIIATDWSCALHPLGRERRAKAEPCPGAGAAPPRSPPVTAMVAATKPPPDADSYAVQKGSAARSERACC